MRRSPSGVVLPAWAGVWVARIRALAGRNWGCHIGVSARSFVRNSGRSWADRKPDSVVRDSVPVVRIVALAVRNFVGCIAMSVRSRVVRIAVPAAVFADCIGWGPSLEYPFGKIMTQENKVVFIIPLLLLG